MKLRLVGALGRRALVATVLGAGCEAPTPPGAVVDLRLTPDSAHLAPGEAVDFSVTPIGESGDPLPSRTDRVRWSFEGEALADFEGVGGAGRLTAREVGTARVVVELGQGRRTADVYIHPPGLAAIAVEPSPVEGPPAFVLGFRAVLMDAEGAEIEPAGFRVSWSVADTSVVRLVSQGTVSSSVVGKRSGSTTLTLTVSGRVTTTPIVIH